MVGPAVLGGEMIKFAEVCNTSSSTNEDYGNDSEKGGCWKFSKTWTHAVLMIRKPIMFFVHTITSTAASRPKLTICLTALISLLLAVTGLFTNFTLITDEYSLWTPNGSKVVEHRDWIDDVSGFPTEPRPLNLAIHADGMNVLNENTKSNIERAFQVIDTIRGLDGYDALCAQSDYIDEQGKVTCQIHGVTKFWNHTADLFQADIETSEDALNVISGSWYPDLTPVIEDDTFGMPQRDPSRIPVTGFNTSGLPERYDQQGMLTSATMFLFRFEFPDVDEAPDFEKEVLDELLDGIRKDWSREQGNVLRLEFDAVRSFEDE